MLASVVVAGLVVAACGSDDTGDATNVEPVGEAATEVVTEPGADPTSGRTVTASESSPADATTADNAEETADTADGAAICGAENFDLSVEDVARTDGYPDPELAVSCDGTTMTVTSNDIIAYEFVQITPNDLTAQDIVVELPVDPQERSTAGAMGLGAIGVAINGVVMFAAFEAPRDGYRDPLLDGLLDFCNGHTAPGGLYHHHARPDCILADPSEPGTVVGYAFDGYEIVVPTACVDVACSSTELVESSYQKVNGDDLGAFSGWAFVEGSGDLDECNGRTDGDGAYRYYATDAFPYLPFCFHGVTDAAAGDFDGSEPAGGPPPG